MMSVMDKIQSSRLLRGLAHKGTMFLGARYPETFPMVYVLGFPKSGTTWVCQLVADSLKLPFPQFALLPHTFSTIVHGHDLPKHAYTPLVYVARDGRDVAVSMFHFELRKLLPNSPKKLRKSLRNIFPKEMPSPEEKMKYFQPFLELYLDSPPASPVSWSKHIHSFLEQKSPKQSLVLYEKLLSSGVEELSQCIETISGEEADSTSIQATLEKFSFNRMHSKSELGAPLRKGISGDWKEHFTKENAQLFQDVAGDMLIALGYEENASWTDSVS
ncbi:MAG: sulfotransferase domain-containing protein [Planctomycetes bacterium]|nr:sulfotransferase domain-containing protein [Planctomycetota bacterium]